MDMFEELTGKGVKIGIVDSGYSGKRNINLGRGINFADSTSSNHDIKDNIGHGTACAGIVYKKASDAQIYPVKIFNSDLVSDIDKLTIAIEWCINQNLDIINLSLGTTEIENKEELQRICNLAFEQGALIVAANSNNGQPSYPATLSNVFGVTGGQLRKKYQYYFNPIESIQFIARGDKQRLDWKDGSQIFMGGTSFAAPHITAIIALLLQKYPGSNFDEMVELLKQYSLKEQPALVDGELYYNAPGMPPIFSKPSKKLSEIQPQNHVDWVKEAVIFPYTKEMHSLVRYPDLLPFKIKAVIDVVGRKTIGKDAGIVIGAKKNNIIVQKYAEESFKNGDTIILGYLDELSRLKRRDLLREVLEIAIKYKKNVYSLSPISSENYPVCFSKIKKQKLHIAFPHVTISDFEEITSCFDGRKQSECPIVGVFGTSPQQGKFTAQLALREELQKIGYKVGQLGTEHQSVLFGFDYVFPNGYDGHKNIQIPMDLHITLLQSAITAIENEGPHIIVVGGQSGLIPYSYAEKSFGYTLPSITLLMGTVPDAYILVVNSIDELDYIHDNINVLKGLGKGEIILLVFSDSKKAVITNYGRSSVINTKLSKEEIEEVTNKLEKEFKIPTTEIISQKGREKMISTVENYFAEE